MDKPVFTKEQIALINAKKHKKIFTLKGPEVFAIHSLGQMQNKVVEYIDIANN
jgi:hypothetical protein